MNGQTAQAGNQDKTQQISGHHRAALAVAIIAGILGWLASGIAIDRGPSVFGEQGVVLYSKGQLSAIGGMIAGILIAPQIKDAKLTFWLASAGLLVGVVMPWLYQIIPGMGTSYILTSARDTLGPALFSFGTSSLVRAADVKAGEPR